MIQVLGPITTSHPDQWRIAKLIANPPAELWDDGRHNLAEVPDNAADYRSHPYQVLGESDEYRQFVAEHNAGEEGPDTYSWDEGIAP